MNVKQFLCAGMTGALRRAARKTSGCIRWGNGVHWNRLLEPK